MPLGCSVPRPGSRVSRANSWERGRIYPWAGAKDCLAETRRTVSPPPGTLSHGFCRQTIEYLFSSSECWAPCWGSRLQKQTGFGPKESLTSPQLGFFFSFTTFLPGLSSSLSQLTAERFLNVRSPVSPPPDWPRDPLIPQGGPSTDLVAGQRRERKCWTLGEFG